MCITKDICGEDISPLWPLMLIQIIALAILAYVSLSLPQDIFYIMSYKQVTGLDLRLTDV